MLASSTASSSRITLNPTIRRSIRTLTQQPALNAYRSRLTSPTNLTPPLRQCQYRYASNNISPSPSSSHSHPMPLDMPREDYTSPTLYTISTISRVLKYLLYTSLGISLAGFTVFEVWHFYIEHYLMITPSGSSSDNDIYGFQEENISWTNDNGGTAKELGWKGRHALRAAWIAQHKGLGGSSAFNGGKVIGKNGVHPIMKDKGIEVNKIDRGFELAEEYIDLSITQAEKKGIKFPPLLSQFDISRIPDQDIKGEEIGMMNGEKVDKVAVELLVLKAGILERISTHQTLIEAKNIYQRILSCKQFEGDFEVARKMRLAGKIGDLENRIGGDPSLWWDWGLAQAQLSRGNVTGEAVKEKKKSWWSWGEATSSSSLPTKEVPIQTTLSPAISRAALNLLISKEAKLAISSQFPKALQVQSYALSLVPSSTKDSAQLPPSISTPQQSPVSSSSTSSSQLHSLYINHRRALLRLHALSVQYAQKRPILSDLTDLTNQIENLVAELPNYQSSNPLSTTANLLSRDLRSLAAEANYTKGLLLEKEKDLEGSDGALEKALEYLGEQRGVEWDRYWRGFTRVREKLEKKRGLIVEK